MVGEHLPVVLAALLNVDDENLLQPKGQLGKHIPLHNTAELSVRPAGPQVLEIKEVGGFRVNVLLRRRGGAYN